jgi:toxin-antitoxin system PIN domain toxin
MPQHHSIKVWLEGRLDQGTPVRLAWITVVAFIRIITGGRVVSPPESIAHASGAVEQWLSHPSVRILQPGPDFWAIFHQLLIDSQSHGNLVTDAFLAALAIEHGATLCTTDRDFTRFRKLKLVNPLD